MSQVDAQVVQPPTVVATPNPAVFPLLLALDRNPALGIRLIPAADGSGMLEALKAGRARAMVAMLATEANIALAHPELGAALADVWMWRGFAVLGTQASGIAAIADVRGKGLLIAGPLSGGRGGGPDLMLKAALRHQGVGPQAALSCYMRVSDAASWIADQKPMGDHPNCEPDKDLPASAILLAEPAATALTLMGHLPGRAALGARLPLEPLFPRSGAWAPDELPLGGLMVSRPESDLPEPASWAQMNAAVAAAVQEIRGAEGHLWKALQVAKSIARQFDRTYADMTLHIPTLALALSLYDGTLRYRSDRPVASMRTDLAAWIADVLGTDVARTASLVSDQAPGPMISVHPTHD